jgi:voltage-gated potassium channel
MSKPPDPWRPVRIGFAALGGVLLAGTVAYSLLGLPPFDAFYQTLITVSTVGYSEVGESIGRGYRIVSALLILVGVGVALYTVGAAFEAIVDGRLSEHMGRARMRHALDQLEDHIIVCGWGQVGQAISRALLAEGAKVAIIDRREDLHDLVEGPAVVGDATVDDVLLRAGIKRARGLVIALDSAADCMYVTLTGRSMNPDLFIVARANSAEATPKLRQAGADRVVSPHEIGGSRMAAFVMQPNVADFLGEAMHHEQLAIKLQEFEVGPESIVAGRSLRESGMSNATGVTVLAVRRADGTFSQRPNAETELNAGDVPIVIGTAEQLSALRAWMDGG